MPSKPVGPELTCIDLFAGCGGLSLGLEQAGFHPLLVSEVNKSALETYLANGRDGIERNENVYDLSDEQLRNLMSAWRRSRGVQQVDLVCGGPPCQGYSGIGHRRSFKVEREEIPSNHLYKEMIRVIQVVRPRVFLFENVRGLLSGRWTASGEKGEIWADVLTAFREIPGYAVNWELVYAKDYGVPQNRPRVLLVGIQQDVCLSAGLNPNSPGSLEPLARENRFLPGPTGSAPDLEDVFGDLLDEDFEMKSATTEYPAPARTQFQREMRLGRSGRDRRGLEAGAPVTEHEYSDHSPRIRAKFRYMIRHDGAIPAHYRTKKFAQRVVPRRWGKEGPTITATSLPDDYVHYEQARSLTVREWARLQTFPDWYVFRGPRTTGGQRRAGNPEQGIWDREVPKYTQIGNAVPVRLARAVGAHLASLLKQRSRSKSEQFTLIGV